MSLPVMTSSMKEYYEKLKQHFSTNPPVSNSPSYVAHEYLPHDQYCLRIMGKEDRVYKITKHAGSSLAIFNAQNNTDYKLVECKEICYDVRSRYRVHCNFTAKPDTAPLKPGDFSTVLFFADLEQNSSWNVLPLSCHMLDDDAKVKLGCPMCTEEMFHPASEADGGISMHEARVKYYKRMFAPVYSENEGALLDTCAVLMALK